MRDRFRLGTAEQARRLAVLSAWLALAARPALADVSDPGTMLIGGQGQVVGTMTVTGNAFSVGGSTLNVNGGRVGIGTASPYPNDTISVRNGNLTVGDSKKVQATNAGGTTILYIQHDGTDGYLQADSGDVYLVAPSTQEVVVQARALRPDNNIARDLGLPAQRWRTLHLGNSINYSNPLRFVFNGSTVAAFDQYGSFAVGSENAQELFSVDGGGMRVDSSTVHGNPLFSVSGGLQSVGVGGFATTYRFQVIGGGVKMTTGTTSESPSFFVNPTNGFAGIGSDNPLDRLHVRDGGVRVDTGTMVGSPAFMVHGTNGRVGMGTATPGTTLDVNGSAQFGNTGTKSAFSAAGALTLASGASLTLAGTSGTGLMLPQYTLAQLRTTAPAAAGVLVMGPSPTYDLYVGTGTAVDQWLNMRTQVGP